MANSLSPELLAQIFAPESNDPFLTLVTLSHVSFSSDICLVNNSEAVVSNGVTFQPYPMKITLPVDDGETAKSFAIDLDNVSLSIIAQLRQVTTPIGAKIQMILASMPDAIQFEQDELKIQNITYNKLKITATIILDDFLNTALTSEVYGPQNFPGLF